MNSPAVATVLRALAELAPAAPDRVLDVTRGGQPLIWLSDPYRHRRDADIDRLAAVDLLHRDERILRRGWGLVAGTLVRDGVRRRIRLPMLSEPVRLDRGPRGYRLVPVGEMELTPLITDQGVAAGLEAAPGLGEPGWLAATGTSAWLRTAAAAAGLPLDTVEQPSGPWRPLPPVTGLVGYLAAALFTVRDVYEVAIADSLRAWAGRDLSDTALAAVYRNPDGDRWTATAATRAVSAVPATPGPYRPDSPGAGPYLSDVAGAGAGAGAGLAEADPVESPLPLTEAQVEVIQRVRRQQITVVSGPPGNGKSHTVVATALDVVDRGGSVLVVTQSSHAADVLADLLARHRGPTPVLFGDAERRAEVAATLAGGVTVGVPDATLADDDAAVAAARDRVRNETDLIVLALAAERLADSAARWEPLIGALSLIAPKVFRPGADLDPAERALRAARRPGTGWWPRWWRSAARRRLARATGAGPRTALSQVAQALDAARAVAARARLAAAGGTDLTAVWSRLEQADRELTERIGVAVRNRCGADRRWDPLARRSAAALATALRAGRNRRREMLAGLDGPALVRALPLWIGTVTDVAELLPPVPGMFDLVILDEASHSDQVGAAPVLARARRALIVGDPRQLRFVSFVADVDVADTLTRHGLDDRLDVRRVSAFDLAAGVAPVTWLDEHFRCVPHLIEFSARRFYADRIAVATRHPSNENRDVIDVRRVASARTVDGVNQAEVAAAVAVVGELAAAGVRGISVVTPFRAQADALETALVDAFSVDRIELWGLRVGTVHAIQGGEADTVVASLAVTDADPPGRLRFLSDPHLFNVLITRARRHMVVLTSLSEPTGLIGDYLRYAAGAPTVASADRRAVCDWAAELGARLGALGAEVRFEYPVGRWTVDICLGRGTDAVGLICRPHPAGDRAHLLRQRTLRRAGWHLVDAFASRWQGDPVRAALEIVALHLPG